MGEKEAACKDFRKSFEFGNLEACEAIGDYCHLVIYPCKIISLSIFSFLVLFFSYWVH